MWLFPFIFVSVAFFRDGHIRFFVTAKTLRTDCVCCCDGCACCGCCRWCFYLVVSQSQWSLSWLLLFPPDADVVWVTFGSAGLWRLVSIDWLCDLPVWLIGLGTYVINLLLFIYKLAGQRPLSRAFAPRLLWLLRLLGLLWDFQFSFRDNRWHPWMVNRCSRPDKLWTELSWAESSTVDLRAWAINASFPANKPAWWDRLRLTLANLFSFSCQV